MKKDPCQSSETILNVWVQPRASRNEISGFQDEYLRRAAPIARRLSDDPDYPALRIDGLHPHTRGHQQTAAPPFPRLLRLDARRPANRGHAPLCFLHDLHRRLRRDDPCARRIASTGAVAKQVPRAILGGSSHSHRLDRHSFPAESASDSLRGGCARSHTGPI